jgi:O-antigen ligase
MLATLGVLCALAAGATWLAAGERWSPAALSAPRWVTAAMLVAVVAVAGGVVAVAARDSGHSALAGASAQRLQSLESNRYDYWKVAIEHGFAAEPLRGIGAGGFAVIWLQHRDVSERAKVAHSEYVQTLAELGIVGLAFLVLFLGGVASAAARARLAGPAAVLVVWAAHSALDWDWEMPALTLVAMVLAGLIVATADEEPQPA